MEPGKATQRNRLRDKTINSSILANDSIDSSPVVNEDEVAKNQKQHEELKERKAEMSSNNKTLQLRLLHHSRYDRESTAATSSVDVKCSIDARLLENEIATPTPEEKSGNSGASVDITRFCEKSSDQVPIQQLILSSNEQKELESVTSEVLAISILEIYPPGSSSLQPISTARSISLEGERHKQSRVLLQQPEDLRPEASKSITTAPTLNDYALKDTLKTLDNVLSRGCSKVVNQPSEILGGARVVIEYLQGPSQSTAKRTNLTGVIDIPTENISKGEDGALCPVALQLIPQEHTSPIMRVHAPEEFVTAESMSSNLHTSLPMRRTRSGARFSDDTNMLKDFLNRAHAKKAVKSQEVAIISYGDQSPRRSPRKVLGQLDINSPSHTESHVRTHSLNTPPGNDSLDLMIGVNGIDKLCGESKLGRRSARACTIMPEKTTLGPLCLIPVRRPERSEPVVLQKSAAQELAITTRANTRRNKGLSKLPKFMLETLTTTVVEDAPVKTHEIRAAKSVDWDKNLVYFQQSKEGKEGKEKRGGKAEVRSGAKSLKELGDVSGIPAPRSVVNKANPSNGTPAPKRRGKIKS